MRRRTKPLPGTLAWGPAPCTSQSPGLLQPHRPTARWFTAEASDPNRWNLVRQSFPGVPSNLHPFPTSLESTLLYRLSLPPLFGSFSPRRPAFRPFLHYQNSAPKHCPHRPEGPTVRRNTFPNPLPPSIHGNLYSHLPLPFALREFSHTIHHGFPSLR